MPLAVEGGPPSIFAVGAWFATLVGPALDQFADPNLGPALALVILALGLVAAVTFRVRVAFIGSRLGRLQRVLRAIPDPAAFALRFQAVVDAFDREPLTKHGWSELNSPLTNPCFSRAAPAGR